LIIHDKASAACIHNRVEVRQRTLHNGSSRIANQCLDCGRSVGMALKRSLFEDPTMLPMWDDALRERDCMVQAIDAFQSRASSFMMEYREYLESDAWAEIRQKVIKRDGGLCQACLDAPAVDVHHLTYDNMGHEFCWQLVAVCRPCHERIHGRKL